MGTSWISRKGGNLRKGGDDLEKGGYDPPTNYVLYHACLFFQLKLLFQENMSVNTTFEAERCDNDEDTDDDDDDDDD